MSKPYPDTPRLVNRFSLGADPEFAFLTVGVGAYYHAERLGMTTLQAFGCDMAGRQAEIRAHPSRFALEVVASLREALRWIPVFHANSTNMLWVGNSWVDKDGCAGHVHFGSKKANRDVAVGLLDNITELLLNAKILDLVGFDTRKEVTGRRYGKWTDFRPQMHGYEYRTLPTWLSSPQLAHLVLTVSKLIVFHGQPSRAASDLQAVSELLQQYAGRDDDALIAWRAWERCGPPHQVGGDFKYNWGVAGGAVLPFERHFIPASIEPSHESCVQLYNHLVQGVPLAADRPTPTWNPFKLPSYMYKVTVMPHSLYHLPDVGMGLISYKVATHVDLSNNPDYLEIMLPASLEFPRSAIREALNRRGIPVKFGNTDAGHLHIRVSRPLNESLEHCHALHDILANTDLFPICKGEDFDKIDWSKWEAKKIQPTKLLGKQVGFVESKPVPVPFPYPYATSVEYKKREER
jgi:hypothetical protein